MDKKTNDKRPVLVVLLLIVIVAVAGGAYYLISERTPSKKQADLTNYFQLTTADAIGISAGSVISETAGRLIDDAIYLDYDSVHGLINPGFYYEESTKQLIVTTPTEKVSLPLIDGSASEGREIVLRDGVLYISLEYLEKWSDIGVLSYPDKHYVAITTEWTKTVAAANAEAAVRTEPTIKADILETVPAGETLQVLDKNAAADQKEAWSKVRTESGLIGYLKAEELGKESEETEEHESPIGEYTSAYDGGKVNMAFHQTTSQAANQALEQVIADTQGINVIAPTWFFLTNENGSMSSLASAAYVEAAHAKGLKVWAVMNDFDGGINSGEATKTALSTEENRSRIIQTVMEGIDASGADGLNVDFERVQKSSAESFLQLIRELSVECRVRGIVLSIDNYVPTYTKFLNRREQARVADFLVTMCYDEHTSSSEEAGSVASLPFLKKGLLDTMEGDGVPADKMIAAIPFYTRLWTTHGDGQLESTAYGMSDAAAAVLNLGMKTEWDDTAAQNYGKMENGDLTYEIWLEDEQSIRAKMEVIRELGIAGVAEWKLGQEQSAVWSVIGEYLK